MHNNDVRLAQKALYADLNWFIANEIDIWEYSPEHTLHMKNLLVDDHLGYVGSFNLDPRSERLSHEVGVVFESKALADQLREQLIADQAQCSALILNGELKKDIKLSWFFRYLILPLLRNQL
jgi:phosphatidylserine/phosphatidylglycerophosphate/cardiolipin synthase-like enzyme